MSVGYEIDENDTIDPEYTCAARAQSSTKTSQQWSRSKICCPGRDRNCKGQLSTLITEGQKPAKVCYCDDICIKLKDCCTDYTTQCQDRIKKGKNSIHAQNV